jgi:hypothetical protein
MNDPHQATVWTARVCAFVWLVSLAIATRTERRAGSSSWWQIAWSAASILLGIHILVAFHFEHAWSHAAAFAHTARQSAAKVGLNWGGGIYFNYAVIAAWLVDVLQLWTRRETHSEGRAWRVTIDWFVAFMMINATVVFGPWGWKPIGAVFAVGLFVGLPRRKRVRSDSGKR